MCFLFLLFLDGFVSLEGDSVASSAFLGPFYFTIGSDGSSVFGFSSFFFGSSDFAGSSFLAGSGSSALAGSSFLVGSSDFAGSSF